MQSSTSIRTRILPALLCLIAASSVGTAFAGDEGRMSPPEPFGMLENREVAYCQSAGAQDEHHCVCSAAGVEVPMTFNEFASYMRLRIPDLVTAHAVEVKLAQWARYCGPDR